jgi:hypothetical protein
MSPCPKGRLRQALAEIVGAEGDGRLRRHFGLGLALGGALDLAIGGNPVGFGHGEGSDCDTVSIRNRSSPGRSVKLMLAKLAYCTPVVG